MLDLSSNKIKVIGCKNFEIPKDLKTDIIDASQSKELEQETEQTENTTTKEQDFNHIRDLQNHIQQRINDQFGV